MDNAPRRGTMRSRSAANQLPTLRLKFLFLGDSGVGKTCWIKRAKFETLRQTNPNKPVTEKEAFTSKTDPTIGVEFVAGPPLPNRRVDSSSDARVQVNFFDCAGGDEFAKVRSEFYSDFQGLVLCFDVGSKSSFEHLDNWWNEISAARAQSNNQANDCLSTANLLLLGLKSDTEKRVVSEASAKQWCKSRGASYFECSSKTGAGINRAFEYLVQHANGDVKPAGPIPPSQPPPTNNEQQQQRPQRPPSASPTGSPQQSSSSSSSGSANISEMSALELKRECVKRGINVDDCFEKADFLQRLREYMSRDRSAKAEAETSAKAKEEKMRDSVLDDVARWARGKDIRAMLNEIHQWNSNDANFLDRHASLAPVEKAYKKALLKIHPDKVDASKDASVHLRATETFKAVNAAFESFRKVNDKRLSGTAENNVFQQQQQQPSSSPSHSPTPSSNPTPRTRNSGPMRRG